MTLQSEFIPLTIEGLPALAAEKKAEGARFVQMLCVNTEEGIDLVYSFMKDRKLNRMMVMMEGFAMGKMIRVMVEK